jgi:hypothetical protein
MNQFNIDDGVLLTIRRGLFSLHHLIVRVFVLRPMSLQQPEAGQSTTSLIFKIPPDKTIEKTEVQRPCSEVSVD